MAAEKRFTRAEVAARTDKKEAMFVIDNLVYDVSGFLDEHPGGHEVLLNVAGKDASEDFDDVGHSLDAKQLMAKYRVGALVDADQLEVRKRQVAWNDAATDHEGSSFTSSWKFPLLVGVLLTVLYSYFFG